MTSNAPPGLRLLVVADDLSGAADCAVAGVRAGLRSAVALGAGSTVAGVDVLAVDVDSRRADAAEAAERHAAAWRALAAPGTRLCKKTDSTLRGNVGAEVAALVPLAGLAIVAPAFPALGRTTRDARQWLHGVPVEDTEAWRNENLPGRADLAAMLRDQGLRTVTLSLDHIREPGPALPARLAALQAEGMQAVVCDAETDEDLRRIADASARLANVFWAGSAGLAPALIRALGLGSVTLENPAPIAARPVLAVVGSMSSVSHAQAAQLKAAAGSALLALEVQATAPVLPMVDLTNAVIEALRHGRDVLITLSQATRGDPADGPAICQRLADMLAPALPHAGALIATGGETARALLAAAGIDTLHIVDEVEPGMPLLLASLAGKPLPVVTKAGGFGAPDSLATAWRRLAGAGCAPSQRPTPTQEEHLQ